MTHQKRYTAEEMKHRISFLPSKTWEDIQVINMLHQAAETESQVAGLVEALEEIVRETVAFGVNDYASRCAALRIAKGALSKFRGEA